MRIDSMDSLNLAIDGLYERFETALVKRNLKPGGVFVDVGAHIGYYSVLAASIVGPAGRVVAFEPEPGNAEILRENTAPFNNCMVYQAALSDRVGQCDLWISEKNSGDHRLSRVHGRKSVACQVFRLDDVEELRGRPVDFLKVDVQGFELKVFKGAAETIKAAPGLAGIVEFGPPYLRAAGDKPAEFYDLLLEMGFHVYMRGGKRRLVVASWPALKRVDSHINLVISKRPLL